MSTHQNKLILVGMTTDGHKFRPSDWAQRLATAVGTPGPGRRIRYHPKVKIAMIEGLNCVLIEKTLEKEEPMLFSFLVDFAKNNNLEIRNK